MKIANEINSEKKDISDIWRRMKTRNFSGNTGLAVKNGAYQFLTTVASKLGSLILTVVLARLLMPELFGLYNLALSTILIFAAFSELGLGSTLVRFVSRELGKKNKILAKAYLRHLGKIKLFLLLGVSAILLWSARFISENYYQKPLFLALAAGAIYILIMESVIFFQSVLQSFNYFKGILKNEFVFQISRLILVPLAVVFALKYSLPQQNILFYIILALAASYFISLLFIAFFQYRKFNPLKEISKKLKLEKTDKSGINKFFAASIALSISGIFFGYIDRLMLGHFVAGEFVGYYSASISLFSALIPLAGFGAVALLPVFSRIGKEEQLDRGMKGSLRMTVFISIIAIIGTLALAYPAIYLIFGTPYLPSVNILRALSPMLIIVPLTSIYGAYFLSKGKPGMMSILLISATALNIVLNYVFIVTFINISTLAAVYGVVLGTVISDLIYLLALVVAKKKLSKVQKNNA